MTDYKIAADSIEEIKNICDELLNAKEGEVINKLSLYNEFEYKLKMLQPIITRIKIRRNETNQEKKIYGEKMIKNVDLLLERYDILYHVFEEELTVFKDNYEIEKNKKIEKKLLEEQKKKENEQEMLNRGRIKTMLEEEEIIKRNEEKLRILKEEEHSNENKMKKMEMIKNIIKEKCNFLYEEISNACNKKEAIKYIYCQLGTDGIDAIEDESHNDTSCYIIDCLYLIYKNNEYNSFKQALKNIIEYLEELVKNIDSEQLKLINLMNKTFQSNILSKKGTLFVFILIGYVLKRPEEVAPILKKMNRDINNENIYIFLEEPDILAKYSEWKIWFENIQGLVSILCTFYRHVNKYSSVPDEDKTKQIFLYLKEKFANGKVEKGN